ncbi:uncharacterized protein EMH_0037580 [Eimeria mitis]|uniref:Uncharacterized protein n=1 Tax=Eimeria mitis TaxID=44415 RepID=U6KDP2_9EIME|nr:uncharacterized protein EMH_0037580 [Eimeria mitis]CDJ36155.1 hypothetical protein, conserved [Eimeria mitis]
MGKFTCLCWRNVGAVNQPSKRQTRGTAQCDQLSERKCSEESAPHEPLQKLQDHVACDIAQSVTDSGPQDQQTVARLDAEKVPNATPNCLVNPKNEKHELPEAFAASTNEKEGMPEVELLLPQDKNFVDSNIPVLDEKLKCHEECRNTSQETTPGNDSRVTSSPISFICPTSTSGGEEDHRAVVSTPPILGSQGNQIEEREGVNDTNFIHGLQGEIRSSFTEQTACRGTRPKGEDDRAVVLTPPIPGTQASHERESEVVDVTNIIREEQKARTDCFSTKSATDLGKEPDTASTELVQPDDINQSLDDKKEPKTKSGKKKRRSRRNKNTQSPSEAEPVQTAGTDGEPLAVAEGTVGNCDSFDDELRHKNPEGEPLDPQTPSRQPGHDKSSRKHKKKKASKAKGKRRHGKTGRR